MLIDVDRGSAGFDAGIDRADDVEHNEDDGVWLRVDEYDILDKALTSVFAEGRKALCKFVANVAKGDTYRRRPTWQGNSKETRRKVADGTDASILINRK